MYRFLIVAAAILLLAAIRANAQPSASVCDEDGGPIICTRYDNLPDPPEEGTDFVFLFDDPDNPGIEFRRGSAGEVTRRWRVWSWDSSTYQNPQNIGTLTATGEWNYEVTVLQPDGDPGALNVLEFDLDEHDPDFFSTVFGQISGDVVDLFQLQRSSGGSGGVGTMTIGDDLLGDLTMYGAGTGGFTIADDVAAGVTITLQRGEGFTIGDQVVGQQPNYVVIDIDDGIHNGDFTIEGLTIDLIVNIDGTVTGGAFQIGDAPATTFITIEEMGENAELNLGSLLDSYEEELQTAVIKIKSDLPASASINAPDLNLAGGITFEDDTPARKDIDGTITLGGYNATIKARDQDGTIDILGSFGNSGHLDLTGTLKGDLLVGGNCRAPIDCDKLGVNGRILIDGTCEADITVTQGTNATSLIQIIERLDTDADIVINNGGGDNDANGDIFIGDPDEYCLTCEPGPVYFGGGILVNDGNLDGDITVVGCHATQADLEICVDGAINGSIIIFQPDCQYEVGYSCPP